MIDGFEKINYHDVRVGDTIIIQFFGSNTHTVHEPATGNIRSMVKEVDDILKLNSDRYAFKIKYGSKCEEVELKLPHRYDADKISTGEFIFADDDFIFYIDSEILKTRTLIESSNKLIQI